MMEAKNRFLVRQANTSDASPLTELLNAIIEVGGTTAMETPLSSARFSDYFLDGQGCLACHVAEDVRDRTLLGFQAIYRDGDLPDDWVDIATFARLGSQARGVGTALFAASKARARDCAVVAINATIRADNHGGLVFYEKIGFQTYRTLKDIPLLDGTPVDRILKRYDITG